MTYRTIVQIDTPIPMAAKMRGVRDTAISETTSPATSSKRFHPGIQQHNNPLKANANPMIPNEFFSFSEFSRPAVSEADRTCEFSIM